MGSAKPVTNQRLVVKDIRNAGSRTIDLMRVSKHGEAVLSEDEWSIVFTALRLSPREGQLVRAVCCELKDVAIADQMNISVHTVRTHFERLFRKLSVHSRVGILICVIRAFRALAVRQDVEPIVS